MPRQYLSSIVRAICVQKNNPIPTWAIKPYADVPRLLDLPEIIYNPETETAKLELSNGSSALTRRYTDPAEGCFVTKTVNHANRLGYWFNGVSDEKIRKKINGALIRLNFLPFVAADVEKPYNRSYFSPLIQSAMDFGFIAITASSSTLDRLITMVKSENVRMQAEMDESGSCWRRKIDLSHPCVTDPTFELVAIHPNHFLPDGSRLSIYDPERQSHKSYIPASDGRLRESYDPKSPRLPSFTRNDKNRDPSEYMANVFLVVLGADIRFKRHFKWAKDNPASALSLPRDVLSLMQRTMELADLLYYKIPVPTKGTEGEARYADRAFHRSYDEFDF